MVYGAPLTVPGTFVGPTGSFQAAEHLQRMREIAGRLVPAPDAWHGSQGGSQERCLDESEFVFVRRDAAHGPLQKPYTGPYRVLQRHEKYFVIQCGEREENVSRDRLKAAKSDPDRPTTPAMPPKRGRPPKQREEKAAHEEKKEADGDQERPTYAQVTRSGRTIRPPERYGETTNQRK